MKAISFCLFGNKPKYTRGIVENLKIIREKLPEFCVYIFLGTGVPDEVITECESFPHVHIVRSTEADMVLPALRICYPVEADILFARDADSRINARDLWVMNEFMKSNKSFHIVRDHVCHVAKIMAGLCGRRRSVQPAIMFEKWKVGELFYYGTDEVFLENVVYPQVAQDALFHCSANCYPGEDVQPMPPLENSTDFLGNVVDYKNNTPYFV